MRDPPFVTYAIVAITSVVSYFALQQRGLLERLLLWPPAVQRQGQVDRLVTYGFVHADFTHLLFNMITLYFFGAAVESFFADRIGRLGFAAFYLVAIVVSILPTYLRHRTDASYRSLGASGAVSAVLFSFILLAPWSMIFVFFLPVPAILYAVFYVGYSMWMDKRGGDHVNHSAHLWGAAVGVLATLAVDPRVGPHFLQRLTQPSFGLAG
jgi:membrane associated rhomboid family serine protease